MEFRVESSIDRSIEIEDSRSTRALFNEATGRVNGSHTGWMHAFQANHLEFVVCVVGRFWHDDGCMSSSLSLSLLLFRRALLASARARKRHLKRPCDITQSTGRQRGWSCCCFSSHRWAPPRWGVASSGRRVLERDSAPLSVAYHHHHILFHPQHTGRQGAAATTTSNTSMREVEPPMDALPPGFTPAGPGGMPGGGMSAEQAEARKAQVGDGRLGWVGVFVGVGGGGS
jgi:hypothetical protein